jgi:hypothetical protein
MGHAGSKTRSRGHLVHFNNQRCQFSGLFLNSGFKPSRKTFDIDINQRIIDLWHIVYKGNIILMNN